MGPSGPKGMRYDGPMKPLRALGLVLLTGLLASGCYFQVTWLADGQHLAYLRDGSVRLIDLDGHESVIFSGLKGSDGQVVAAPAGSDVAVSGSAGSAAVLAVVASDGTVRWSRTLPNSEATFQPGCWSPDGASLAALDAKHHVLSLVDLKAGTVKAVKGEKAVSVRFGPDGGLLCLRKSEGGATVARRGPDGTEGAKTKVTAPQGLTKVEPLYPSADGSQVWFGAKRKGQDVILLVSSAGAVVLEHAGAFAAVGPDDASFVSGANALVRAGGETDLGPVRARIVTIERNWQMADPEEAKKPFDESKVDFHPVFSPDGRKAAVLTGHLLCVADLSSTSGEVSALAKW